MIVGFLLFAGKRRDREIARALHVAAMGARGAPKDVNSIIKQLSGE